MSICCKKYIIRSLSTARPNRYGGSFAAKSTPTFKSLLMKFYRVSHPDVLSSTFPKEATVNSNSLQVLNNVLGIIKQCNTYPPKTTQVIPFYVSIKGNDKPIKIDLIINTPGGDCRKVLQKSFEKFFTTAGILEKFGKFDWGTDYFPNEVSNDLERKQEEFDE